MWCFAFYVHFGRCFTALTVSEDTWLRNTSPTRRARWHTPGEGGPQAASPWFGLELFDAPRPHRRRLALTHCARAPANTRLRRRARAKPRWGVNGGYVGTAWVQWRAVRSCAGHAATAQMRPSPTSSTWWTVRLVELKLNLERFGRSRGGSAGFARHRTPTAFPTHPASAG